jgi:hypothetical protein
MSKNNQREDFMKANDRNRMQSGRKKKDGSNFIPRTHETCIAMTGVARPGKTAKDRANKLAG